MNRLTPASLCAVGVLLVANVISLHAAEPQPLISKSEKLLLSEEFSASSLPTNFQPGGRAGSFSIVDGALQGVAAPDDAHGPSVGVPIEGHNLTILFSVKLAKPGVVLFLVDGESQFGGSAHLLRVGLGATYAVLQQDRGSPASKQAQAVERAEAEKAGRKPTPATKEQLADPKFYRTEVLDKKMAKLDDGKWHQVLVEIRGNEAVAQVDDVVLRATGAVFDVKKSRLVFLVGQSGTMLIDNVKVWENSSAAKE